MTKNFTNRENCNTIERFETGKEWYNKFKAIANLNNSFFERYCLRKVEVEKMPKEIDLKKIISNLAKLGVSATATKSRMEMLKVLVPPVQDPQIQSQ